MKQIMDLHREFTSFEGSPFKYSLSFSLLLAFAPSLLLIAMLFHFVYLPMDAIMKFLISFMPDMNVDGLDQVFQFFADQNYNITSFIVTTCVSFCLASRSIFSFLLINASHGSVGVPRWSIRIKSVVLFASLVLLLVLFIFIATRLNEFLPIVSAVIMLPLFTMMYRTLSSRKRNWLFGIIGVMFSTICILGLAALFIIIVSHFTSYEDVYDPLVFLVTLLLAIYLMSYIIYLGSCLNLIYEEDYGKEGVLPLKNERFFILCNGLTKRIRSRFWRRRRKNYTRVTMKKTGVNGEGIGYINRMPVLVPWALVGEGVEIHIVDRQRRYAAAGLPRVVKNSKNRIRPKCFIQNTYGACPLMIARYPAQLEYKQGLLKQSLIEYAQVDPRKVARVKASEDVFGYRNQFKPPCAAEERRLVNDLFMPNSNYFIDVRECWVHEDGLGRVRMDIMHVLNTHDYMSCNPHDKKGIRNLVVRSFNNRYRCTIVTGNEELDERLISDLIRIKGPTSLRQNIHTIKKASEVFGSKMVHLAGETSLAMELGDLKFQTSPRSFFQLNGKQAVQLYRTIASMVKENNELIVETYNGIDAISLYLKDKAKEIVGIESIKDTIVSTNQNIALNDCKHVSFLCDDAANKLIYLSKKRSIDVLVVDPPRSGLDGAVLECILRNRIKNIIYVSCNPVTLGKNLAVLYLRYNVDRIQPIDIFPHTSRVGSTVLMSRKNR